mmetsp:Transcript_26612/g.68176  ORF Transcript_26612/g.68176 Transcript_26612/m.68176 type:complete len:295 (-) Transcript_26612:72-956(-)
MLARFGAVAATLLLTLACECGGLAPPSGLQVHGPSSLLALRGADAAAQRAAADAAAQHAAAAAAAARFGKTSDSVVVGAKSTSSTRHSSETKTLSELWAMAEALRLKISALTLDTQKAMNSLQGLAGFVNNVSANATRVSVELSTAFQGAEDGAWNASRIASRARRANDSSVTLGVIVSQQENKVTKITESFRLNSGAVGLAKEFLKVSEEIGKYFPGGEIRNKVDGVVNATGKYEQLVRESVDRTLLLNNSYELKSFVNDTNNLLKNLSEVLVRNLSKRLDCLCPPCKEKSVI